MDLLMAVEVYQLVVRCVVLAPFVFWFNMRDLPFFFVEERLAT
jgi:hypothetical protein